MLPYFVEKCQDPDIRSVLQFALGISNQHINSITAIFNSINFPIPHGFTDEDFDVTARQLFSDSFMLMYTRFMAKYGMLDFSSALATVARPDVSEFFEGCLKNSIEISRIAHDVLLAKGLFPRAPYIPIPDRVEYVHDVPSFFEGLMGDKRPLNALEIGHIFSNIFTQSLKNTLTIGFGQVTKSKLVRDYLSRGKQINDKQIDVLSKLLKDADLSIPLSYDNHISESLESPYSDKLIMFHLTIITAYNIIGFGLALANCARSDVVLTFSRLIAELAEYVKEGIELMIKQGWLERVPESANRKELRTQ
jgi:hypothetical protein